MTMDSVALRSRLLKLLQKGRKAVRMYSEPALQSRSEPPHEARAREMQTEEWRAVTVELTRDLGAALENPNVRRLMQDLFSLRDRAYSDFRLAETELHLSQKELVRIAEQSDFIKAAFLADKLIRMKARLQATQAVHHELAEVLSRSTRGFGEQVELSLGEQYDAELISLSQEVPHVSMEAEEQRDVPLAKVIPLRQKRVLGAL